MKNPTYKIKRITETASLLARDMFYITGPGLSPNFSPTVYDSKIKAMCTRIDLEYAYLAGRQATLDWFKDIKKLPKKDKRGL